MYYKRFTSNRFLEEKNPTIVNFPLRGVDMSDCASSSSSFPSSSSTSRLTSPSSRSPSPADVDPSQPLSTYYDLTANLTHQSLAGTAHAESRWRTHVHLRAPRDAKSGELTGGAKDEDEKWFEMEDLQVREIEREMVSLGETYIQVRRVAPPLSRAGAALLRASRVEVCDLVLNAHADDLLVLLTQIWERRSPTGTWDLPVETPKPKGPRKEGAAAPAAATSTTKK